MTITSDQEVQLRNEVALGQRASSAYSSYIKDFVDKENKELFSLFISSEDLNELPKLKEYQLAIAAIEAAVLKDIETGKMAVMQLNKQE
jgi:hypothetical protein